MKIKIVSAVEVDRNLLYPIFREKYWNDSEDIFCIPTKEVENAAADYPGCDWANRLDKIFGSKNWRIAQYIIGI